MVCNHLAASVRVCYFSLSNDVASGSEITPCNNIDKSLVVYRLDAF